VIGARFHRLSLCLITGSAKGTVSLRCRLRGAAARAGEV
jgi:hypothetical protein